MEYVDVLDAFGRKTGIVKEKKTAKLDHDYTLGAHVIIMNSKHEVLVQKRSDQKHNFPGMWDITGGHVRANESSLVAIQRETFEELGVLVPLEHFEYLFQFPAKDNFIPMFLDVYLLEQDIDLEELQLQKEEVADAIYIPFSTFVHSILSRSDFVKQPYFVQLVQLLEAKCYESGCHSSGLSHDQLLHSKKRGTMSCC